MKQILIVFVGMFFTFNINSQIRFNNFYLQDEDSINSTPWGYSILDVDKDTIKLNALGASGFPGYIKSYLYNIIDDSTFNIINRLDGTNNRVSYNPIPRSFIHVNDSLYVQGCTYVHYTPLLAQDTIKSGLIFYNKNGDTLYSKWFGQSVKFILRGFERIENHFYLLGVTKVIGDGTKAHLVKTDLAGNLIWEKTLTAFTSFYCNAISISKVNNNGYFVQGIMNSHDVGPIHISNIGLYKIDSSGNIIWYKNMFNNANGGFYNISEDGAGNYYLSGNIDTMINTTDHVSNQFILKMDSNTNIIWMHIFNETPQTLNNMWHNKMLPNGDLVFCGEQIEELGSSQHIGILGLMNSTGQVKWEHFYKQNDSSNYNILSDAQQMPDGGFIATGICRDSITSDYAIWLIRTDSNGCLVPGCVAPNAIEVFPEQKMNVVLFPNPSNGDFLLSYNIPSPHDIMIRVIDITGRVVKIQHESKGVYKSYISLKQPKGIYLVQLIGSKGEKFYSTKVHID